MSGTNNGNQLISFYYDHPATSSEWNKHLKDILKPGIYQGGALTVIAANTIRIAPFVALIQCSSGEMVRIETQTYYDITITESTPYVVVSFSWVNSLGNYADFTAKAFSSIYINDVVLGRGDYTSGNLTSTNLNERTFGLSNISGDVFAQRLFVKGATYLGAQIGDTDNPLNTAVIGNIVVSGSVVVNNKLSVSGDGGSGEADAMTLTGTYDSSTNSTGIGTILFKGTTNRNSEGFLKVYINGATRYIPVFSDITG